MLSKDQIRNAFQQLTVWKKGSQRAPHKPLLVLMEIRRCLDDESRYSSYVNTDEKLRQLLIEFGPTRKTYHPELPFWHLQTDGIWELTDSENLKKRQGSSNPTRKELLKNNVKGGFIKDVYDAFTSDKAFALEITEQILDAHFPESVHDDLLQAVGIDISISFVKIRRRDPEFRIKILRAYEYRCAICGFDVRIDNVQVALEAAHIKWHQAGGPDIEENGLALCALHHKLFDRGVLTLNDELRITISELAHGTAGFSEWLASFQNQTIRMPKKDTYLPDLRYIHWHHKEVFREARR